MTLTYRRTKGAQLTSDEADANFDHVLLSSNHTFVQSGSGAVSSTVQAALRLFVHTSQYSTTANYNTARDALTGTIGVPSLDVAATLSVRGTGPHIFGVQGASVAPIKLATGHASHRYSIHAANGDVGNPDSKNFYLGYNVTGLGLQEVASEPVLKLSWESQVAGGTNGFMEWNFDYTSADGLTTRRLFIATINRSTHLTTFDFLENDAVRVIGRSGISAPFKLHSAVNGQAVGQVFEGNGGAVTAQVGLDTANGRIYYRGDTGGHEWQAQAGTVRMRLSDNGILSTGAPSVVNAATSDIVLPNNKALRGEVAAANNTNRLIQIDASNRVNIAPDGNEILWGQALVALGGGAAPTFGTIGGSGPAAAAQNSWMRVVDTGGAAFWVPVWK